MTIISQFNKLLEDNFNNFLKKYFYESNYWDKSGNISNYINFMSDLDSFNYTFITNIIKLYFEYIDEVFFNSSYRKSFCESKGFYKRTILTLFGEITYKRRYYYDKKYNDKFFFTDYFLNFPKRKYFDSYICSEICNESASFSYSKAGKIVANKVGKRINNLFNISRASARNIVMNFNIEDNNDNDQKRIERLYIMLDEKFVGSQFNSGIDHMIKAAVIFENTELVYKYKLKPTSIDRYKLVNPHTCASIDNNLLENTLNYIYNTYDIDSLKEINFMGDCALWIKNFPKSNWFKFNKDIKINFAMDGFHFSQALHNLTTTKYNDVYDALYEYVLFNNKKDFTRLCNEFLELNLERKDTIENKRDYILNNWNARQLYQNSPNMKCSMESHISHIFADIFTSRPKAYSKKGLRQLLKLRLLKVNNKNIKDLYFKSLQNNNTKNNYQEISIDNTINNYHDNLLFKFINNTFDNYINFI
jgi:hypothetical protein